jgi:ankyrin repeat protein
MIALLDSQGGYTALIMASECGHLNVVKLLISKGADVNAINEVESFFSHSQICMLLFATSA